MTVLLRTPDELQACPGLATLPALSASIEAVKTALDVAHPHLLAFPGRTCSPRENAALLLHMHLDACQALLLQYDQITFDEASWHASDPENEATHDPVEDIPF